MNAMCASNGWAITGYNVFLKSYVNFFIDSDSMNVPVCVLPVIVIDMAEHAYYRDFLNNKKAYLHAQLRELNWSVIEERFRKMEAIAEVIK